MPRDPPRLRMPAAAWPYMPEAQKGHHKVFLQSCRDRGEHHAAVGCMRVALQMQGLLPASAAAAGASLEAGVARVAAASGTAGAGEVSAEGSGGV